jgi:hypothetical protein
MIRIPLLFSNFLIRQNRIEHFSIVVLDGNDWKEDGFLILLTLHFFLGGILYFRRLIYRIKVS